MNTDALNQFLQEARQRQQDELVEWLRIPSISTLPDHKERVAQAAQWLAKHMAEVGLEHVEVIPTNGHPLVYADWRHAGEDKPTVLIYGHYDVQPVDPVSEWDTPPFEPTVKQGLHGDDLYARGASDDKGQVFVHVKAVEALLKTQGSLPVNVKFIVEGEEEVGSHSLTEFIPAHEDKLAADVCLISDTHILSPTQPVIIYGLRGMWAGQLTVSGPARDLHSGSYGGAIHNPNQALCELLAALHDEQGHVLVPGFYDDVRTLSAEEREALAQVPYGEEELLAESGAPAPYGEPEYTVVERTGARPTLEINGIWGGFIGDGFKTVIPREAHAKISCRLVPDQDPERIYELINTYLQSIAPPTVKVRLDNYQGAPAAIVDLNVPEIQAARRAYERSFGAPPIFTREGGSIPIVTLIQQVLNVPVILMGFGLPDDNLHAPNEKMHLPNFFRGIQASTFFLDELARLQG
jgi:acetylornithine deacetylase/succinyl-diaminopimelate desuccinylase-like protein